MPITDIDHFYRALRAPFIIFAGSFVSRMGDIAPVVDEIRSEILLQMGQQIMSDGRDRSAAHIARYVAASLTNSPAPGALLATGAVSSSVEKLKFEEFIRRMALLHPKDGFANDIVRCVYETRAGHFNYNHGAIAHLLKTGLCSCVLTTNFDTALENACQAIGYTPKVYTLTSAKLQPKGGLRHAIVKLHGCAVLGDVVADSSQFLNLRDMNQFDFIEDYINTTDCAIFGYSGYGDIDICPHIRRCRPDRVFWSNWQNRDNPFPGSQTCIADLTKSDMTGRDGNLLLGLATRYGWNGSPGLTGSDYKTKLELFLRSECGIDYTRDAFLDLLGLYHGHVHAVYWYGRGRSNFIRRDRYYTKDPRLLSIPLNIECRREIAQYSFDPMYTETCLAFIDWRMGANKRALDRLVRVLASASANTPSGRAILIRAAEIANAVIAEDLWLRSRWRQRTYLARIRHILGMIENLVLSPWWQGEETVEFSIKRRARSAQIAYCATGDKKAAEATLSSLFEDAKALELYEIMIRLTQGAWLVDRKLGNALFKQNNRIPESVRTILAVRMKNISHYLYNVPIVGRYQFFLIEKIFPRIAEFFFNWRTQRWGTGVQREVA